MSRLDQVEARRLLSYLRNRGEDIETLAHIEDELRGEYADEFLREPELLAWFPLLQDEIEINGAIWLLRIIPHAHLRMVQRGIKMETLLNLFQRFVQFQAASGVLITTGPYSVFERARPREVTVTLRFDVDLVTDEGGQAHVVTVFIGRGHSGVETEIELL
jgi:hypothetical protein